MIKGNGMSGHSRNKVSLELVQVDVERAIEPERSGDGRNNLSDQPVQVGETWGGNTKVLLADVVDSFVIDLSGWLGDLVTDTSTVG